MERQIDIVKSVEDGERSNRPYRIVAIGDKEIFNAASIVEYSKAGLPISLVGVITPGGNLDDLMQHVVRILGVPIERLDTNKNHNFSVVYEDTVDDIPVIVEEEVLQYAHAYYDSDLVKTDYGREFYCAYLAGRVAALSPDIIFLSNFKLILHKFFVEAFSEKIINIHPSVLPLLKGWRPERAGLKGKSQEAIGYTMHVVAEDLDGGPTLFSQRVQADPYDEEEAERIGFKEYELLEEERLRLKIIMAQSKWSPLVLALYALGGKRVIVEDREAFVFEGRAGFEDTEEFEQSLRTDFEYWKKSNNVDTSFEQWKEALRKPYQRMLFDVGCGWQTMESIFGVPGVSESRTPHPLKRFEFTIGGKEKNRVRRYAHILNGIEEKAQNEGGKIHILDAHGDAEGLYVSLLTTIPVENVLKAHRIGKFTIEEFAVNVTEPRKPLNDNRW